jgi:signal peptidase II
MKRGAYLIFFLTCVVVICCDQWSKTLIIENIEYGGRRDILPGFFSLTLTLNRGAAFGLFAGIENDWIRYSVLAISSVVALVAVFFVVLKEYKGVPAAFLALGGVVGGALGNAIDRFQFGGVVDFLDVYWRGYHWPAFNVADSCICTGVGLLLLLSFRSSERKELLVR